MSVCRNIRFQDLTQAALYIIMTDFCLTMFQKTWFLFSAESISNWLRNWLRKSILSNLSTSPIVPSFVQGSTRLLVTHQRHFLPECDRILLLRAGRVIAIGTPAEVAAGDWPELAAAQSDAGQLHDAAYDQELEGSEQTAGASEAGSPSLPAAVDLTGGLAEGNERNGEASEAEARGAIASPFSELVARGATAAGTSTPEGGLEGGQDKTRGAARGLRWSPSVEGLGEGRSMEQSGEGGSGQKMRKSLSVWVAQGGRWGGRRKRGRLEGLGKEGSEGSLEDVTAEGILVKREQRETGAV